MQPEPLPPAKGPTLGWVPCHTRQKVQCVACNRKTRHGIRHVNDRAEPPARLMCLPCYRTIMATPPMT
jgi:hypothetical protein